MDEAALIAQARTGSVEAFSKLVELHQARVRSFVGRFVRNPSIIDDIAQDVFLAAFRGIDSYHGESSVSTWLLGIARNRALVFMRDETRRRNRESGRLNRIVATAKQEEFATQSSEISLTERELSALEECVKALPGTSAQLLEEHYLKARPSNEIAKELGRSESAVRMTLLRIRQALRDCIRRRLTTEGA